MPPYAPTPQVSVEKPTAMVPKTVRVLLAENFRSVRIHGAQRSMTVDVELNRGQLQLIAVKETSKEVLEEGTGFRLEPSAGRVLKLDGRSYRGAIEVFINPVGRPVVVNQLSIEAYLRGVVPKELSPGKFPELEAMKAQAVAARTFTVRHLGGHARFGFDLYKDQRSQAYGGIESEEALSDRGIRETRGVIGLFHKHPIWALYCSTCGGRTEAYHEIFKGDPIEYLRGGVECHDEASPYHSWEERIQIRDIQSRLDRYAGVGQLKQLKPLRRSQAGRLVEMRFEGDRGVKILKGNDIRFALGLKSNFITALKPVNDSSGLIREIMVRGKGWGHGVGMCQIGAVELAARGKTYEEIMKYYYNGITLSVYE